MTFFLIISALMISIAAIIGSLYGIIMFAKDVPEIIQEREWAYLVATISFSLLLFAVISAAIGIVLEATTNWI